MMKKLAVVALVSFLFGVGSTAAVLGRYTYIIKSYTSPGGLGYGGRLVTTNTIVRIDRLTQQVCREHRGKWKCDGKL